MAENAYTADTFTVRLCGVSAVSVFLQLRRAWRRLSRAPPADRRNARHRGVAIARRAARRQCAQPGARAERRGAAGREQWGPSPSPSPTDAPPSLFPHTHHRTTPTTATGPCGSCPCSAAPTPRRCARGEVLEGCFAPQFSASPLRARLRTGARFELLLFGIAFLQNAKFFRLVPGCPRGRRRARAPPTPSPLSACPPNSASAHTHIHTTNKKTKQNPYRCSRRSRPRRRRSRRRTCACARSTPASRSRSRPCWCTARRRPRTTASPPTARSRAAPRAPARRARRSRGGLDAEPRVPTLFARPRGASFELFSEAPAPPNSHWGWLGLRVARAALCGACGLNEAAARAPRPGALLGAILVCWRVISPVLQRVHTKEIC